MAFKLTDFLAKNTLFLFCVVVVLLCCLEFWWCGFGALGFFLFWWGFLNGKAKLGEAQKENQQPMLWGSQVAIVF